MYLQKKVFYSCGSKTDFKTLDLIACEPQLDD